MVMDGKVLQANRQGLEAEGFESGEILRRVEKRPWYRADGTLIGVLPVDVYHEQRFRAHGWSLSPTPRVATEPHFMGFDAPTPPPDGVEDKEEI